MRASKKLGPIVLFAVVVGILGAAMVWRYTGRATDAVTAESVAAIVPQDGLSSGGDSGGVARQASGRIPADIRETLKAATRQARNNKNEKGIRASAALQSLYRSEPVDAAWAAGMETRLQKVAQEAASQPEGVTPTSLDIDCRRTTCKIDATHPDQVRGDDWAMMYMAGVGSNFQRAFTRVVRNPDGTSSVVIYAVAR